MKSCLSCTCGVLCCQHPSSRHKFPTCLAEYIPVNLQGVGVAVTNAVTGNLKPSARVDATERLLFGSLGLTLVENIAVRVEVLLGSIGLTLIEGVAINMEVLFGRL